MTKKMCSPDESRSSTRRIPDPVAVLLGNSLKLAATVCGAPVALLAVWKGAALELVLSHGKMPEDPDSIPAFLARAAGGNRVVAEDLTSDPEFSLDPLVRGEYGARSFFAFPWTDPDGGRGLLGVIDFSPRSLSGQQAAALELVAEQIALLGRPNDDGETRELQQQALDERSQSAVVGMDLGVWDWNIADGSLVFSDKWIELLGNPAPEEIPRHQDTWAARVHPEDLDAVSELLKAHFDGEMPVFVAEFRFLVTEGNYRWIHARGNVTSRDDSNQPLRMVGTHTDITGSKQAEIALRASEERLAEALRRSEEQQRRLAERLEIEHKSLVLAQHVAKIGSWDLDIASGNCVWSREVYNIFEVSPEIHSPTLDGFYSFVHPEDKDNLQEIFTDSIRNGTSPVLDIRIVMPDGRVKYIEERWQHIYDDEGRHLRSFGTCLDITDRKLEQKRHYEQSNLLKRVMDDAADHIYIKDLEGRYLLCNLTTAKGLGFANVDEVIGKRDIDMVSAEDAEMLARHDRQVIENPDVTLTLEEILTSNGEIHHFLSNKAVVRNDAGKIVGILGISRDVTEIRRTQDALLQSENRLQFALEASNTGVWEWDIVTNQNYYSPLWAEMLGYTVDEIEQTQQQWLDLMHPDDLQPAFDSIARHMSGEADSHTVEHRLRDKDGQWRWILTRGRIMQRDADGKPLKMFGTHTDIHEFKRLTSELAEQTKRMELANSASAAGVWQLDCVAQISYWDDTVLALYGYSGKSNTVLPQDWFDVLDPADRDRAIRVFHDALADADVSDPGSQSDHYSDEFQFIHRQSGETRIMETRGIIQRDAEGRATRVVGINWDVTERRLQQKVIQEQATLLDKAQDAISVRDLNHVVSYWNRSAENLYGWTEQEMKGRSVEHLLHADPAAFHEANRETLEKGEWSGELSQINRAGDELTVECRWTLLRDEQNQPKSILAIHTDITASKKLEQHLLRSQRMESIGTLAGGIAHDLNNALTPILLSVSLLKINETDPLRTGILDTVETSAKHGASMIKQLLTFARGAPGEQLEVPTDQLLMEIATIVNETFLKTINVKITTAARKAVVLGDVTQLHQILINLCVNARDAMPNGGTIHLSTRNVTLSRPTGDQKSGDYCVITVADTGIGIPPENLGIIFDPFFTTKEIGQGTGLGLASVLTIVKNHGGFIQVESKVGIGSSFHIYLPVYQGQETPLPAPVTVSAPGGDGQAVLIVDDEPAMLHITRHALEMNGYSVLVAQNGETAMACYLNNRESIDLVLTDMMMPSMDGSSLISALRRINPDLRIIASSGLNSKGMARDVETLGVSHYLPKPYTVETLLRTVADVVRSDGGNFLSRGG